MTGAACSQGMPDSFAAGRYHSLIAERERLPEALAVTAWTEEDEIMGVRHPGSPSRACSSIPRAS